MAVDDNKLPKLANQFWPRFIKKQTIIAIFAPFLTTVLVCALFIISGVCDVSSIIFWAIIIAIWLLSTLVSLLIVRAVANPTKILLSAIVNLAGEHSELKPPNPNSTGRDVAGLSDALQTIYQLAANQNEHDDKPPTNNYAQLATALEMTKCGFVAMDADRKIIYSNQAAPISITSDHLQHLQLIFNGNDSLDSWIDSSADNTIRADHVWTRIPDKLPNEENRRLFDVIASYRKESNPAIVIVLIDRTAVYSVDEEDLDFISFAAHELRGPITVIKGYVDILQDELSDSLKGDQVELFKRLAISSNRLSGYIDNILNTSRYDRRHLKMHMLEDTVSNVYDMIADDMKLRASSQNRLLTVNIPQDLPTIAVDKASMSEVFSNLIDNAIKYSNEGGLVTVEAKAAGDFVEVSVQDNGIGMPESVISNLFKKFYRSHRSRETVAGTGIGLYISKAIVESHGGTISVRSRDGHGSIFTVSIPTYATVADKLKTSDNSNEALIKEGGGWINNHSMYRG